jgi:putative ABC transport system permease protein
MNFLIAYSLRNLWRHPRRTLGLATGIALSVTVLVGLLTFTEAALREITREITAHFVGEAQLVHESFYLEDITETNPQHLLSPELVKPTNAACPRTTTSAFLGGKNLTTGVQLVGLDPECERKNSALARTITQGTFLSPDMRGLPIILGARLARKLEATLGDELVFLSQGLDGSIANELFTLVGIFDFGGGDAEEVLVFTSIPVAREFMGIPSGHAHQWVYFDEKVVPQLASPVRKISWREILPDVHTSLHSSGQLAWFICFIVALVVGGGVGNTLLLTFREREAEFKTLSVIGVPAGWTLKSLLVEVAGLAMLALLLGNLLAVSVVTFFHHVPVTLSFFTGGQPLLIGGLKIFPRVSFPYDLRLFVIANLLVLATMAAALIYPLWSAYKRGQHAA